MLKARVFLRGRAPLHTNPSYLGAASIEDTELGCLRNLRRRMTRRQFSRESKREAAHLVLNLGVIVARAARDLELNQTVLRRRILQYWGSG